VGRPLPIPRRAPGRHNPRVIVSAPALEHLLDRVRAAPWVALDTEANSRHCYRERLCLVQLTWDEGDALVDPLAGLDLAPLFETLRAKPLLLHGADFDLRLLRRSVSFVPERVIDTDLAARLAGHKETSLSALAASFLGVHLEKSQQAADWARRPLTDRLLAYAEADTRHLKTLWQRLEAELDTLGRLDWHAQSCAELIRKSAIDREPDPERDWRVRGSSSLKPAALAALRELWHWREQEAEAVDRPPVHVLTNESLVRLAEETATRAAPALPPALRGPRRERALEAVRRARELLPERHPGPLVFERSPMPPEVQQRFDRLKGARDAQAGRLAIEPTLIASRAALESLARDGDAARARLLPWQRALLFGD